MNDRESPVSAGQRATSLDAAAIIDALRDGSARFRELRGASIAYAAVFAIPGLLLLTLIGMLGVSPLALPFAGGFMLIGPIQLCGYFELARRADQGQSPRLGDALAAFRLAPRGLWLLALVFAFLFLIWITDAGVLYSFTLGGEYLPYDLGWVPEQRTQLIAFTLWGSLMGSVLAFMIFAVSAFSVPLVYERRAGPVDAVIASVRTVFADLPACLGWGLLLGTVIVLSVLLLPLLLVTLPVMSYASFALYRRAFPEPEAKLSSSGEV